MQHGGPIGQAAGQQRTDESQVASKAGRYYGDPRMTEVVDDRARAKQNDVAKGREGNWCKRKIAESEKGGKGT